MQGGLVVEFNRLNRIIDISVDERTATVEPGVVWKEVEYHLNNQGLTLNLPPTDAGNHAEGDAEDAGKGSGGHPHAGLYVGTDAGSYAQNHGGPDAQNVGRDYTVLHAPHGRVLKRGIKVTRNNDMLPSRLQFKWQILTVEERGAY